MSEELVTLDESDGESRIPCDALKQLASKEEPRFIGILIKDKDSLMDAMAFGIRAGPSGHFWTKDSRFLFSVIASYYRKYKNVLTRTAMESVMESMDDLDGQKIDDDDRTAVRMFWDKAWQIETSIADYALLRDHINARYIQWQAYKILKSHYDSVVKSISGQESLVKKIREDFTKIDNLDADPYCMILGMKDGMEKVIEYITDRREHPDDAPAVFSGLTRLDDIFHGFPYGSYTLISGMINGGKTTLMFNIAFNMAKAGEHVVYVSIEKEAIAFFTRLLALHALVDYNRILIGGTGDKGLNDYYFSKLKEAADDIVNNINPNFDCIQVAPGVGPSKILAEIEKIKATKKIDALFIDYLGVIGFETHHAGRPDIDEAIVSKALQAYGKINRIATFAATQLKTPSVKEIRNKSQKATDDDPSKVQINTEDLSGSKMIPADADNVIGVVLNADVPSTKMYANITKARDAQSKDIVTLDFDGRLGRISDPEFEPGQVTNVDKLVYDKGISEEKLKAEDGLFAMDEDAVSEELSPKEEVTDDDFSFLEKNGSSKVKEEPKAESKEPKKTESEIMETLKSHEPSIPAADANAEEKSSDDDVFDI